MTLLRFAGVVAVYSSLCLSSMRFAHAETITTLDPGPIGASFASISTSPFDLDETIGTVTLQIAGNKLLNFDGPGVHRTSFSYQNLENGTGQRSTAKLDFLGAADNVLLTLDNVSFTQATQSGGVLVDTGRELKGVSKIRVSWLEDPVNPGENATGTFSLSARSGGSFSVTAIPEPSSLAFLAIAILGSCLRRHRVFN